MFIFNICFLPFFRRVPNIITNIFSYSYDFFFSSRWFPHKIPNQINWQSHLLKKVCFFFTNLFGEKKLKKYRNDFWDLFLLWSGLRGPEGLKNDYLILFLLLQKLCLSRNFFFWSFLYGVGEPWVPRKVGLWLPRKMLL